MNAERTQEQWEEARNRVPSQHEDTRKAYLQLRWEEGTTQQGERFSWPGDQTWLCHYELVLPLSRWDIRRETGEDGFPETDELVIAIKPPTVRTTTTRPCSLPGGEDYADTPFRDGAHARWDRELLGNIDVYVVTPAGKRVAVDFTPPTPEVVQ